MYSDCSEDELLSLYQKSKIENNINDISMLENEVAKRVDLFLTKNCYVDTEASPYFFNLLRVFNETSNTDLKILLKKAEVKLIPILKKFDEDYGLDSKEEISEEQIEQNLTDINYFEENFSLERPDFRQIKKVFDVIDFRDENENLLDINELKEKIEFSAKVKTYLRLCLNLYRIESELYYSTLKAEFEKLIVSLLMLELGSSNFSGESMEKEIDKFLEAIE
ncbi:MAG: hypothetical protein MJ250_00575 [Alphaproteobacteria bacterium]|nr:hypothetical protein [Alphaproteobacteria bacterium]